MDTLDYNFFLNLLKENGTWLDETCFYFMDDPKRMERWLGCIPSREKPYWIGGCDVPGGTEYLTAEELMEDSIFDGKSLKERWAQVRIECTMGVGLEDWHKLYAEYGGGPSPRGEPRQFRGE